MEKNKKKESMYQNRFLEILSISNPKVIVPFHLIISSSLFYTGYQLARESPLWEMVLFFMLGFLVWSLAEYLLHRYVFHFVRENRIIRAFHYAMHGYHHKVPHDDKHLFMPPVPAFVLLTLFFGIFYLFLGQNTWFFLPGFEIGYLMYSMIHYVIHRKVPKNRFLNKLWVHHATHHYKQSDKAFGVSSMFWDRVFGTMPVNNNTNAGDHA